MNVSKEMEKKTLVKCMIETIEQKSEYSNILKLENFLARFGYYKKGKYRRLRVHFLCKSC